MLTCNLLQARKIYTLAIFCTICIYYNILNVDAGYGEVWIEMNWCNKCVISNKITARKVYNNEQYFENDENYKTTKSGMKFALLPLDDDVDNDKKKDERKKINKGDTARVMYKLYLHPMTKSDRRRHIYSQANLDRAFDVIVGGGKVIKGFDEAIYQMKVGDKGRFVLPPHIGYGREGQAGFQIPGGATLIYYLEVVGHTPKSELFRAHSGASDAFSRQFD